MSKNNNCSRKGTHKSGFRDLSYFLEKNCSDQQINIENKRKCSKFKSNIKPSYKYPPLNDLMFDLRKNVEVIGKGCSEDSEIKCKIKCWKCNLPMIIHGYPFYVCENLHLYNDITEREGFLYFTRIRDSPLLTLRDRVIHRYKDFFFHRNRSIRGSKETYNTLADLGEQIYDHFKIKEIDLYDWGQDKYRHHAGMRFASNIMAVCIKKSIDFKELLRLVDNNRDNNLDIVVSNFKESLLKSYLLRLTNNFTSKIYERELNLMIKNDVDNCYPSHEIEALRQELIILSKFDKF